MIETVDTVLAKGPPAAEALRETIATLYRHLPVRGDAADADELLTILRLLYRIARADLPLARLFEGHVDALQIVSRYGDADMRAKAADIAASGGAFGVWNAALPDEPLRVTDGVLLGGKSFASGAGILTHALAGADTPDGNRLVLIDLAASAPDIDHDWWRVVGMQRSQTHVVRWHGATGFRFIGQVGDYAREPYFSGGALRFVACHAGGIAALFDHVRDHLNATARAGDPYQTARLADLHIAAQSAASWVRNAAMSWAAPNHIEQVAAARVAVAAHADQALSLAQQAIGVSGMFTAHPLSAALTDLMVYLRQPAPDAQHSRVGKAAAAGTLAPEL
jgi:hypothetical protein